MKLNTEIFGEPKSNQFININIKTVGNGSLADLINSGKIQYNQEFDQSIIYTSTNCTAYTHFAVPSGDSYIMPSHLQKFTSRDPIVGVIMAYGGATSSIEQSFMYTDYAVRNNPFLPYLSIGYGVTEYGKNPYGDGEYKLAKPTFVTGYPWQNVRFHVGLYVTNIADITDYNKFDKWDFKYVSLQEYIDNVNNIKTDNPDIVGADISPILYQKNNEPELYFTFYTTIDTSNNEIPNDYAKDVKNDTFFINQNRKHFLLGAQYPCRQFTKLPIYYGVDGTTFEMYKHTFSDSSGTVEYYTYIPRLKCSLTDLIKTFCYLGVPIATNQSHAMNDSIDSDYIYTMGFNDSGLTDGNLKNGKDNKTVPQIDYTDDILTNNNFDGIDRVDPNNYTDKIDLNKPTLSNVNVFNRSFAVTSNNVRQLADFLWNADETKFDEIVKGLALMGENPMNGIIDLRLFPFNVALKNSATQAEPIVIGRTNTGVNGIKLTENVNSLIDLGECTFFEKFKNFLDFEPYTTAQLYIPYIGVIPVSTAEFMGHRISVKMIVDYTTGAGTAIVFKDDIPFIYRNGVVGVSIPMTGTDSVTYANTVIGNVVSGAVGGVTSIASGNIGGMVSSAEKLYNGFATGTNYQEASASSPSVATWQPQHCYFIIDRPILNVPNNYGRSVGYACEKTGKLSDFKGFTVVSNPEINFRCTDSERQYIVNMLQGGVFV